MITRHFFKTLFIFTAMIALGLAGVFLVNYYDQEKANDVGVTTVAK